MIGGPLLGFALLTLVAVVVVMTALAWLVSP